MAQAQLTSVPPELSAATGTDGYLGVLEAVAAMGCGFDGQRWHDEARRWLARGLAGGEIDACRAWLDMAVRLTGILRGLPGRAARPDPCLVPVGGFQRLVRALARPRHVPNPLMVTLPPRPASDTGSDNQARRAVRDPVVELAQLPGLEAVARQVSGLVAVARAERARQAAGVTLAPAWKNAIFAGGPGSGKSRVAAVLAGLYKDVGVLSSGQLVEVTRADLSAPDSAQTSKIVGEAIERSLGGILFVSDAHIAGTPPGQDDQAIRQLEQFVSARRGGDLVIVLAGPAQALRQFRAARPRLAAMFPATVSFSGYTPRELAAIFAHRAGEAGLILAPQAAAKAGDVLARAASRAGGASSRLAVRLLDLAAQSQAQRIMTDVGSVAGAEVLRSIEARDVPDALAADSTDAAADPLAELEQMAGLDGIKREVRLLAAEARATQLRADAGMRLPAPSRHMIFTGQPGTAKTTVARLIAAIYARSGILSSGHLVEVTRADLIGTYIGETAAQVTAVVSRAVGGVLFIDEAYSLTHSDSPRDYGPEAIATLVKLMEDHRHDLVVIAAGYEQEMSQFLRTNPGLASRFPRIVHFPGYTDDELVHIFAAMAGDLGFQLADGVTAKLREILAATPRGPQFGNARHARNLLEQAIASQAMRITTAQPGTAEIRELRPQDLPAQQNPPDLSDAVGPYL